MLDNTQGLSLRYLGSDGAWRSTWPPSEAPTDMKTYELLPRAVELRVVTGDIGELRRVIELPSAPPELAAGANPQSRGATP